MKPKKPAPNWGWKRSGVPEYGKSPLPPTGESRTVTKTVTINGRTITQEVQVRTVKHEPTTRIARPWISQRGHKGNRIC